MINRLEQMLGRSVPRETLGKLDAYATLLADESSKQNLVAASTLAQLWERHIFDSAQLLALGRTGSWVDIGSGAGLPGMVLAIVSGGAVTLVEPRRLRAEFLAAAKLHLELPNVTIVQGKSTTVRGKFDNITARAVGPATAILTMTHHLSHSKTVWVLPKGRTAQKELDDVRSTWQGAFRLEPSLTDDAASILLATGVKPRGTR